MLTERLSGLHINLKLARHKNGIFTALGCRVVIFSHPKLRKTDRVIELASRLIALSNLQEDVRGTLLGHICQHLIEKGFREPLALMGRCQAKVQQFRFIDDDRKDAVASQRLVQHQSNAVITLTLCLQAVNERVTRPRLRVAGGFRLECGWQICPGQRPQPLLG